MKKIPNEVFVITSIDYQYNDEYYYATEENSGSPVCYFSSVDDANKKCQELNLVARKEYSPEDFECYNRDIDLNDIDFFQVIKVPIGK